MLCSIPMEGKKKLRVKREMKRRAGGKAQKVKKVSLFLVKKKVGIKNNADRKIKTMERLILVSGFWIWNPEFSVPFRAMET